MDKRSMLEVNPLMDRPRIARNRAEYYFRERCHISEWWNSPEDREASVARARVEPAANASSSAANGSGSCAPCSTAVAVRTSSSSPGRTRAAVSLDEAIVRGQAARDLGADAVFIEAPESVAELEQIARAIPGPKVANMVEHGRTPLLSSQELHALGFDLIVTLLAGLLASAKALQETYTILYREGTLRGHLDRLLPFDDFNRLVELERHYALEEKCKG